MNGASTEQHSSSSGVTAFFGYAPAWCSTPTNPPMDDRLAD